MYHLILVAALVSSCGPSSTGETSNSPDGRSNQDEETGSVVYVPEGREDEDIGEGAVVANETTGAYLSIPGDVDEAGPSTNVNAGSTVTDEEVVKWTVEIPVTIDDQNADTLGVYYHIEKEDGSLFYGVLAGEDVRFVNGFMRAALVGLGNYHPGTVPEGTVSTSVQTSDEILTKSESGFRTNDLTKIGNKVFAGLERNYLFVSDDGGESFSQIKDEVPSLIVRDVTTNSSGAIILATGLGVGISDDEGDSFELVGKDAGMPAFAANSVYANGSTVYTGTPAGLAVIDGTDVNEVYTEDDGLPVDKITCVFFDDTNDILYAGTESGLAYLTSGASEFAVFTTDDGLGSDVVRAVYVDADQRLWVGTTGGLSYKPDGGSSFQNLTTTQGLPSEIVLDVINDAGQVYVGTDGGLALFTMDSVGNRGEITSRTKTDGLQWFNVSKLSVSGSDVFVSSAGEPSISNDSAGEFGPVTYE